MCPWPFPIILAQVQFAIGEARRFLCRVEAARQAAGWRGFRNLTRSIVTSDFERASNAPHSQCELKKLLMKLSDIASTTGCPVHGYEATTYSVHVHANQYMCPPTDNQRYAESCLPSSSPNPMVGIPIMSGPSCEGILWRRNLKKGSKYLTSSDPFWNRQILRYGTQRDVPCDLDRGQMSRYRRCAHPTASLGSRHAVEMPRTADRSRLPPHFTAVGPRLIDIIAQRQCARSSWGFVAVGRQISAGSLLAKMPTDFSGGQREAKRKHLLVPDKSLNIALRPVVRYGTYMYCRSNTSSRGHAGQYGLRASCS